MFLVAYIYMPRWEIIILLCKQLIFPFLETTILSPENWESSNVVVVHLGVALHGTAEFQFSDNSLILVEGRKSIIQQNLEVAVAICLFVTGKFLEKQSIQLLRGWKTGCVWWFYHQQAIWQSSYLNGGGTPSYSSIQWIFGIPLRVLVAVVQILLWFILFIVKK